MTNLEGCPIMSDLTDPAFRRDIFRTERDDEPRLRFEARVKALNVDETTELFKAILASVTYSPNTNVRNAAVGVLPMLNFASMDQGEITDEYIAAVDTLTGQMDTIPDSTERGREMMDIGQTLSPHFLRVADNVTRLTTSCTALAEKMPYEHYYENPYRLAQKIVEGPKNEKTADLPEGRSTEKKTSGTSVVAAQTRRRIIAVLASTPETVWKRKELAEKLEISESSLNGQLGILHVSLSRKWRRLNRK